MTKRTPLDKTLFLLWLIAAFLILLSTKTTTYSSNQKSKFWNIQSIDTMKLSRDLAREKANDPEFEATIKIVIKKIAATGATHVAVGTPYDEEFLPYLKQWVFYARQNGLKVWFRGNFAGWEQWFEYTQIDSETHLEKLENFINNNPGLFEDGDLFTTCTECENGSLGDPRKTGNLNEYREFLIKEHQVAEKAFSQINKKVSSNYFSMNGDVAKLVMNPETADALGNLVVIDHYVGTPEKLANDITEIANSSQANIVLGEFGAPIPDIHGDLNDEEQEKWIAEALSLLSENKSLKGINYWTSTEGSTSLWNRKGEDKPAKVSLEKFYNPKVVNGIIINQLGRPIQGAIVTNEAQSATTDIKGNFSIILSPSSSSLNIRAKGYNEKTVNIDPSMGKVYVFLQKADTDIKFEILLLIKNLLYPNL